MTRNQTADLAWRDTDLGRVPVSVQFDDPYYSLDNGLAETQHVFLTGNNLPSRFGETFQIAELGFGTGLNFLTTWEAWNSAGRPGVLNFTSFEAFPITAQDAATALQAFPTLAAYATELTTKWDRIFLGPTPLASNLTLNVVSGDARVTLPHWQGRADAWFLDGFSPAKNPELWEPALIAQVGLHTAPNGTAATYSAAGHVRQSLAHAGFAVTRIAGYGRKRHMTTARMPDAK